MKRNRTTRLSLQNGTDSARGFRPWLGVATTLALSRFAQQGDRSRLLVSSPPLLYAEWMARDFVTISSHYLLSIDAEMERLQNLRNQVEAAVTADQGIAKSAQSVRKGMSEEGRRRVAEAQKARWAKLKKASKAAAKTPARNLTPKQLAKTPVAKKAPGQKSSAKKTGSKRPVKKSAVVETAEQA